MEHLQHFKEKIYKLLEPEFKDIFINLLLDNSSQSRDAKSSIKWDWYEQKLYAIKRLATETRTTLSMSVKKEDDKTEDKKGCKEEDKVGEEQNKEDTKEITTNADKPTENLAEETTKREKDSIENIETTKEESKTDPDTEKALVSEKVDEEEKKEEEKKKELDTPPEIEEDEGKYSLLSVTPY